MFARLSNRMKFFSNINFTVSVRPLRFLATINSATPGLIVGVVVFGAVEQQDDVGVLLDGAATRGGRPCGGGGPRGSRPRG